MGVKGKRRTRGDCVYWMVDKVEMSWLMVLKFTGIKERNKFCVPARNLE